MYLEIKDSEECMWLNKGKWSMENYVQTRIEPIT